MKFIYVFLIPLLFGCEKTEFKPIVEEKSEYVQEMDTIHLEPIYKENIGFVTPVPLIYVLGVICENWEYVPIDKPLGKHCICGSFKIRYWVVKKNYSKNI